MDLVALAWNVSQVSMKIKMVVVKAIGGRLWRIIFGSHVWREDQSKKTRLNIIFLVMCKLLEMDQGRGEQRIARVAVVGAAGDQRCSHQPFE
jgi:hypothetical protein